MDKNESSPMLSWSAKSIIQYGIPPIEECQPGTGWGVSSEWLENRRKLTMTENHMRKTDA